MKRATPKHITFAVPYAGGVVHGDVRRFVPDAKYLTVMVGGCGVGQLPLRASITHQRAALIEAMAAYFARQVRDYSDALKHARNTCHAWTSDPDQFAVKGRAK